MKAPFKKLPVIMRDHLCELTSSELKVWLYLFLRSNEEGTSFPSNKTIADDIGMDRETVKTAKRGLRDKGWTARLKQRKREDGSFSTVVEESRMPWLENTVTGAEKGSHGTVAEKNRSGKIPPAEVDTGVVEVTPQTQASPSSSSIQEKKEGTTPTTVVDVVSASPEKENENQNQQVTIAGYTPEEIQEHVAKFPKGSWVWTNATPDALRRPGFVTHVMGLEPPRRVAKAGSHAATNPDLHTGLDANGESLVKDASEWCDRCADYHPKGNHTAQQQNPNCAMCKGPTYANPTWEDDKPYCADCMKMPRYRRDSGQRCLLTSDV